MEDKKTKARKNIIPAAESFSSPEAAGWLFKLIHEGWLRKRWRKRYCVLSNGILYFYEFKTSDGTEKTCSTLNLKIFGECIKAPRKDCKKSAHTLILEPAKKDDANEQTKNAKTAQREFFYTETAEDQEKWIAKLQEALSFTCIGGGAKLTHITKTRARPPRGGGNRRPPTKQHIKERAMMSEVSLEADTAVEPVQNGPAKKRGLIPASALKPPPGGRPKSQLKPLDLPPEPISPPAVNGDEKAGEEDEDLPTPPPVPTPTTPKPPPAALKPPSTKRRVIAERTDSVGSGDGKSLPPPSPQLLKELSDITEKERSLPSSRASSLGKSDKSSRKSSKEPSISSQPGTPPLSVTPPVIELEEAEQKEEEEEPPENGPTLQKLNGNHHLDFLNDVPEPSSRMAKAKSMVDLDRSSDEDEPLPPPPTPPPPEELEKNGVNGDVKKKKKNAKNKKDKKEKKKKGKNRPSSLVLVDA